MSLEFEDNRVKVKEALFEAGEAFLYEAAGELQARTRRNSRVDTGQTKGSYEYKVSESYMAGEQYCQIGSNLENAIWEEFGTGEYALHHNGRKGGWVYQSPKGEFYYTKGKTPNRPLYNAFTTLKNKLVKQFGEILKSKMGG